MSTLKRFFIPVILLIMFVLFYGCSEEDPEMMTLVGREEIEANPENFSFSSPYAISIDESPELTLQYEELGDVWPDICENLEFYFFPGEDDLDKVTKEFVIASDDSFNVTIHNCPDGVQWQLFTDEDTLHLDYTAIVGESIPGNEYDIKYTFTALSQCKGSICFVGDYRSFLITYVVDPQEEVFLNLDKIVWIYESTNYSSLKLRLEGTSNTSRFNVRNVGDGMISVLPVYSNPGGSFSAEVPIASSHVEGVYLKSDTELGIYGTVGCPHIVELKNPLCD